MRRRKIPFENGLSPSLLPPKFTHDVARCGNHKRRQRCRRREATTLYRFEHTKQRFIPNILRIRRNPHLAQRNEIDSRRKPLVENRNSRLIAAADACDQLMIRGFGSTGFHRGILHGYQDQIDSSVHVTE
jgi:hypothetical protein